MPATTLLLLLTLSAGQPAPEWVIIDRTVVLGQVPRLAPPPANLPLPQVTPTGVLLPAPLDSYVGAQLTALRLYPDLAQLALDDAVKRRSDQCELEIADTKAGEPTFGDKLRSGLLWGAGGAVVGILVSAFAFSYFRL